ncbi:MAG: hypothetical protein CMO55_04790 [Verrucomicrobiales bacterium]|nr:hypothetical protein [Verrucomicrobiales bacterium]
MKSPFLLALSGLLALVTSPLLAETEPLLKSGDKVVIVGNTIIERARLSGHLETALQLAAGPEVEDLSFRNLGWSGDSVFGDSRSYFGTPEEGRTRLSQNLTDLKPTVALLCYGTGAAMSVESGWTNEKSAAKTSGAGMEESLKLFTEAYQELIERVRTASGPQLREIVLISPPPLENLPAPLPDQTENNKRLAQFRDAIRDIAVKDNLRFVDLFNALGGDDFSGEIASPALTTNGVHYSETGYQILAKALVEELGYPESASPSSDSPSVAKLRSEIIEKNRLFFHRWRPANETYLFLFRKHEQGQNAKEIPMFDPLIEEQEKSIEKAKELVFSESAKQ